MRPSRAPLRILERAYRPKPDPRLIPRLIVVLIWVGSVLLTVAFGWFMTANLGLALAVSPFIPLGPIGCQVCEAGGFTRLFELLPRPTRLAQLEVPVRMCPVHYAEASEAVEHFERARRVQ